MPGSEALASEIAAAVGAAGWCAVATGGVLRVVATAPGGRAAVFLDGRPLRLPRSASPDRMTLPLSIGVARALAVRIDSHDAIGSPLALPALRRVEGLAACDVGGLDGWAWHPGDPDRTPRLDLIDAAGRRRAVRVLPEGADCPDAPALSRPRRFVVPAATLGRLRGPFALRGADGADLLGSPLDPAAEAAPAVTGTNRPPALRARRRAVDVVVPVYAGLDTTLACLDSLFAHSGRGRRIVVVDDASPEPALAAALDRLAARRRIRLFRHGRNRGFPAAANAGIAACAGRDAVLVNSDVLVFPGWLEGLRAAAYAAPDIGSATALSNEASILSYPGPAGSNTVPGADVAARTARLALSANRGGTVDIPVGVGHCLYLRRDCLDATGPFRGDVFAQGYGEEVDFCLRAGAQGWRHVAATGVFVAHIGRRSFGAAASPLLRRNQAVLDRLHPGFAALVADWTASDPLAPARRRLDEARWRAARPRGRRSSGAVLFITHDQGGGVERSVAGRAAAVAAAGIRPIVLRPAKLPDGGPAAVVGAIAGDAYPNRIYALPSELRRLAGVLRADRPLRVELHHLMGHDEAVLDLLAMLDVAYEVHVHDYALFCQRVALVGPSRRYCGEPDVAGCERCVAEAGRAAAHGLSVSALIDRSTRLLRGASRVVAPSEDAARRIRRHFPATRPVVEPHEVPVGPHHAALVPAPPPAPARVITVGAIGVEKGYDVLLDCARDAAARNFGTGVCRGRSHDRRRPADRDRSRFRDRRIRSRGSGVADPCPAPDAWVATVGVAGDLVLRVDRHVARRTARRGIRYGCSGGTHSRRSRRRHRAARRPAAARDQQRVARGIAASAVGTCRCMTVLLTVCKLLYWIRLPSAHPRIRAESE